MKLQLRIYRYVMLCYETICFSYLIVRLHWILQLMLTLLLLKLFYFYINVFNNKTPSPDSPTNTQNAKNSRFNNQEDLTRFQFDKERLLIIVKTSVSIKQKYLLCECNCEPHKRNHHQNGWYCLWAVISIQLMYQTHAVSTIFTDISSRQI